MVSVLRRTPLASPSLARLPLSIAAAPAARGAERHAVVHGRDPEWINDYRHQPDPDRLPLARACAQRNAGVQGLRNQRRLCRLHRRRARRQSGTRHRLVAKMLPIAPADHWVLVRAIAYSGLPNWKDLLTAFADRMPERRPMIDRYLDGKLPTLDQIAYQTGEARHVRQDQSRAQNRQRRQESRWRSQPSPELIDVLWGYYLATGAYKPIGQIIKLLPLADDKDSVDNLTTGSAAKFTLASNAVRDLTLLAMLKWSVKSQPKETAKVLNEVIETAEDVDTGDMRKQSLAAIERAQTEGPELQTRSDRHRADRPGRTVDGLHRRRGHRANRTRHSLRDRRRGLFGRHAVHGEPVGRAAIAETIKESCFRSCRFRLTAPAPTKSCSRACAVPVAERRRRRCG